MADSIPNVGGKGQVQQGNRPVNLPPQMAFQLDQEEYLIKSGWKRTHVNTYGETVWEDGADLGKEEMVDGPSFLSKNKDTGTMEKVTVKQLRVPALRWPQTTTRAVMMQRSRDEEAEKVLIKAKA